MVQGEVSDVEDEVSWPLILRTGFGNVFANGRWDHDSTYLIARAVNTGDWEDVREWAREAPWDDSAAC